MDEAPGLNQILRHWNQAIKLADASDEKFFIRLFVAVGISAMTFVRQTDELLERLEEYLGKPKVVALGEVGLDPVQYGVPWSLEEQKKVLREQFILAKKASKRVILHTPTPKSTADYVISLETATEKLPPLEDYRRVYLEKDLELIAEVGLDQGSIVVDHVDQRVIDYVLRQTTSKIGISIGSGLRKLESKDAATMVARYGADRILLNSDVVAYRPFDLLAIPKTIREMMRMGIEPENIRRVVYDNAREFYSLPMELSV
jgi:predicted metal-dependent TIM-barrel fold hydrolase